MPKDTSPFAFPDPAPSDDGERGMTIRQWYAGLALLGLIINPTSCTPDGPISARAFELADALIARDQENDR